MNSILSLRASCNEQLTRYRLAKLTTRTERTNLFSARRDLRYAKEAQVILQKLAAETQSLAHQKIAKIVSKCLSAVFEEPYEFQILFEMKRGRTEAKLVFMKEGQEVNPKLTSGGVREVAALALRLASLTLALPPNRKLLIIDEGFTGIDAENLKRVSSLIKTLSREMKVQFLIVTHNTQLQIGNVIEL